MKSLSISILGSTGSIGTQTLQVCRDLGIEVNAISACLNIDLLEKLKFSTRERVNYCNFLFFLVY